MNTIKLLTQKIENFEGCQSLTIDANGRNLAILGRNGVGKTTAASAYCWLFWDADYTGLSPATLAKPVDKDNNLIHHLETSVELVLEIDGKKRTLKRLMRETWSVKSGQSKEEGRHTGYESVYFLDGVEYKTQKDFFAELAKLVNLEHLRRVTNPVYFLSDRIGSSTKKPEDVRRETLIELCGSYSEDDVLASSDDLAELIEAKGERTVDNFRAYCKSQRDPAVKERTEIPIKITTHQSHVKPVEPGDHAALVTLRTQRLNELLEKWAAFKAGDTSDLDIQIRTIEGKMLDIANSLKSGGNPARDKVIADRRALQEGINTAELDIKSRQSKIMADEQTFTEWSNRLDRKRQGLAKIKADIAAEDAKEFPGAGDCIVCGRPLPEDQVAEAEANFNTAKAGQLKRLRDLYDSTFQEGKKVKDKVQELGGYTDKDGTKFTGSIELAKSELADAESQLADAKGRLSKCVIPDAAAQADPSTDPAYAKLAAEKSKIETTRQARITGSAEATEKMDTDVSTARTLLQEAEAAIAQIKTNEETQATIDGLRTREKELSVAIEEYERGLFLCEGFVKAQADFINERVSRHFQHTDWKLAIYRLNEGVTPCCKPLFRGSGASGSTGERLTMGIDICSALGKHYGIEAPFWLDQAECLTEPVEMTNQVIRLKAVEGQRLTIVEDDPFAETEPVKSYDITINGKTDTYLTAHGMAEVAKDKGFEAPPVTLVENPRPDAPRTKSRPTSELEAQTALLEMEEL